MDLEQLEADARRLDPGPERRAELTAAVLAYAERFFGDLGEAPAFVLQDHPGAGLALAPPGETGQPIDAILQLLREQVDLPGANGASGRHFAFIPPSTQLAGALGDFLAAVTNKYAGYYFAGPGAVRGRRLEQRAGLGGARWEVDAGGGLGREVVVLQDRTYVYPLAVTYRAERRDEARAALSAVLDSLHPLPARRVREDRATHELASHWLA